MRTNAVLALFAALFALGAVLLAPGFGGRGPEPGAEEQPTDGSKVYTLDFAGKRHTLAVSLWPTLETWIPSQESPTSAPLDLELGNESGYPLRVRGNGQRSVMFIQGGGRSTFDRVRGYADMVALRHGLPKAQPYPSPGLRGEQAVEGTVFLAKLRREDPETSDPNMLCVLIEKVGDTSLTLRVAPGPKRKVEGHVDASFYVRVKGRLVNKASGAARPGAWLMPFPERGWGSDAQTVKQYREYHGYREEARTDAIKRGVEWRATQMASMCPVAITDEQGRFDVIVVVPWSINHIDGRRTSPAFPPARSAVAEMRVELEGQEPVIFAVPKKGTWTEHPTGASSYRTVWATWDMGDVGY